MHRFFTSQILSSLDTLILQNPKEIHHLKDVLRLRSGSSLMIFNANNEEAHGEITVIQPGQVQIKILSVEKKTSQKIFRTVLACAIPKKAKFELIIEKATELGIDEIVPLLTQRTEVRLTEDKAQQKQERFHQVAINAAKQCQRNSVPQIQAPIKFQKFIDHLPKAGNLILIPWLEGERQLFSTFFPMSTEHTQVTVLIGPEGDFTKDEVALAKAAGAIPVSLGETVLKVDTAAISAVALLNFFNHPHPKA